MMTGRITVGIEALLALLLSGCLLNGEAVKPAPPAVNQPGDPLLELIVKQDVLTKQPGSATLKADPVLKEIPLQTPLRRREPPWRSMDLFAGAVSRKMAASVCACTAFKRKTPFVADKVMVKLFYEKNVVVAEEVAIEYAVLRHE